MCESITNEYELGNADEAIDPRVQVELERLNTATDDINKLEVDLDESRANFRRLLNESSLRIDALGKKLGSCVDRSRAYYDARIKAKEALHQTQSAAIKFEKASSAHSAAKEMVYLAEEGLCAEGRTFDHAWQEMLNHATMRVNESELERTLSEAEHRQTSQSYQHAEIIVQQLQKELKRSIAKSSFNIGRVWSFSNDLASTLFMTNVPYFELKAQYNQVLEEQKKKVKDLEAKVSSSKSSYAEALHNLEQISDEIHKSRKTTTEMRLGIRGSGVGADSLLSPSHSPDNHNVSTVSSSTNADTDHWTDSGGSSDSEPQEEYLELPDKLCSSSSPIIRKNICTDDQTGQIYPVTESKTITINTQYSVIKYLEDRSPMRSQVQSSQPYHLLEKDHVESEETFDDENKIHSLFSKMVPTKVGSSLTNKTDPWPEVSLTSPECEQFKNEVWTEVNLNDSLSPSSDQANWQGSQITETTEINSANQKSTLESSLSAWICRCSVDQESNSRRQSLDTLILGGLATGERFKEIFSQGIMKLNMSSLTDRPITRITSKNVPSPLTKSMVYLNPDDESTSDSESQGSVEMLNDDQISSLMLDQDLNELCQDVLGTPLSEVAPLFSSTIM